MVEGPGLGYQHPRPSGHLQGGLPYSCLWLLELPECPLPTSTGG